MLQTLDVKVRSTFVYSILTLREDRMKVQLALKTLNWNVTGQSKADAFLGLEISAKHMEQ